MNGGFSTNMPASTQHVELPSNVGYNKNYVATIGGNTRNLRGIETSREFGSVTSDLTRVARNFNEAKLNSNKKIDGAKAVGSPEVQLRNEKTEGQNNNDFVKNGTANTPASAASEVSTSFTGLQG